MHNMEMLSALQSLCEGNPTSGFPSQRDNNVEFRCFLCYQPEKVVDSLHKGLAMGRFNLSCIVSLKRLSNNQSSCQLSGLP